MNIERGGPSEQELGLNNTSSAKGSPESELEYVKDETGNDTDVIRFKRGKEPMPPDDKRMP